MKRLIHSAAFLALLWLTAGCNSSTSEPQTDIIERSCVRFVCEKSEGISMGSGFAINEAGNVVTNNHVTAGAKRIFLLHRINGQIRLYAATIVKRSIEADLSVVSSSIKAPPMALNLSEPKVNATVYSLGYPGVSDAGGDETLIDLYKVIASKMNEPELSTKGVDITEDMNRTKLLAQMVVPSGNSGGVRRLANQPLVQVDDSGKIKVKPTGRRDSAGNSEIEPDRGRPINTVENGVDIGHGNSGGPLFDRAGYVVGVVGQSNFYSTDQVRFAISAKRELVPFLREADVPFTTVEFDVSQLGHVTWVQKVLISFSVAGAMVAIGLGLFLVLRHSRQPSRGPGITTLVKQLEERLGGTKSSISRGNGGRRDSASASHNTVWELEFNGPGSFRQMVRLTDSDFVKARGRIIVGRSAQFSHIQLKHDSISRQHLHFELQNGCLVVADRNSSNGTKVNGSKLSSPFRCQSLREGDNLQFGELAGTAKRSF